MALLLLRMILYFPPAVASPHLRMLGMWTAGIINAQGDVMTPKELHPVNSQELGRRGGASGCFGSHLVLSGGPGEIWELWAHPNQSQHFWGTVNIACHKKHLNRWTQTTPLPVPLSSLAWDTSLCISATLSFALRWVRSMNSFPAY